MIKIIFRVLKSVDKKSRNKFFNLQILSIVLSILNIVSIILVVPFINILSNENIDFKNNFFYKLIELFDLIESDNLFLTITLMFVIFYSLTTLTTFVLTFLNIKWVQEISLYFKSILYNYYINK